MPHTPTVLCVDDDPTILNSQKEVLESAGFSVLIARSGPEAIHLFHSRAIDIVLMDYLMTGMTGVKVAEKMKALKPKTPIIFLSAYSELPGESLGLAEQWMKKGEKDPEQLISLVRALSERVAQNLDCTAQQHFGRKGSLKTSHRTINSRNR
ncbi:MAG TPA: response regulator [Terriglobales bacterium]|nr:response regulator [Terriglobales bacterium]